MAVGIGQAGSTGAGVSSAVGRPPLLSTGSAVSLGARLIANPWVSYPLIAALQLKIIWAIWKYRDITGGDTSSYFYSAYQWAHELRNDPVWSPLYTAYYGTIQYLIDDVYASAIFHRALIVMAVTLGVLAVSRQLLPPALALLLAAWWALLPINFEVLYEVHLFAFLPVLAAWIVAGSGDNAYWRGAALAILVIAAALARLELFLAAFVYAAMCLVREIGEARRSHLPIVWHGYLGYAVPLFIAALICAFFVWRSFIPLDQIGQHFHDHQALNMCQGYTFTWLQIHPDSKFNPWLECRQVMQSVFRYPWLTLPEMIAANPQAVAEYFLWNLSLVPSGLQVALFDATFGSVNPDYGFVRHMHSRVGLVAGILSLAVVVAGSWMLVRRWGKWGHGWFVQRRGSWLMALALVSVSIPVFLAIRPRPSYLFPTTLTLTVLIGIAVYALVPRRALPPINWLALLIVSALIVLLPSYYESHPSERPLHKTYESLLPFRPELARANSRGVLGDFSDELTSYLNLGGQGRIFFGYEVFKSWQAPESFTNFLDRERFNIILIDARMSADLMDRPELRAFVNAPESVGWHKLGSGNGYFSWLLLCREPRS